MVKEKKITFTLKDLVASLSVIVVIVGAVAYAHTTFAYREDVVEIRSMVFDLWKDRGLHHKGKKK